MHFRSRYLLFGAIAVLIGSGILLYVVWAQHRDYPSHESREKKGSFTYDGLPIDVDVVCDCPEVLTQSIPRQLNFEVRFRAPFPVISPKADDGIAVEISAGGAVVDYKASTIRSELLLSGRPIVESFPVTITPKDVTLAAIVLKFTSSKQASTLGLVEWQMRSQSTAKVAATPIMYAGLIVLVTFGLLLASDLQMTRLRSRAEKQLQEAKQLADSNPKNARYAWDLARVTLEQYFARNLIQVNLVFWVAVFVMSAGFILILIAIVLSLNRPSITPASLVSAIAGGVAQFIGATFMVIYKSTMTQASDFVAVLNGINRVGMAAQMLEGIDQEELKSQTRAKMAVLLLGNSISGDKPDPPSPG